MDIQKPEPLQVGDRFYYTLTSYDPVSIELKVPCVTDQDVDWALASLCEHKGLAKGTAPTDAWVAENLEGATTVADVKESIRIQIGDMNSRYAEESKPSLCAEQLASRLCQSIPKSELERTRQMVYQGLEADARQRGAASFADLVAQTGMSTAQIDRMLDEEAQATAEQEAALDAYASERKLSVADEELPALLNLSPADTEKVINDAKEHGQTAMLHQAAVREKASHLLAAECACTYVHETEAEAQKRVEQYEKISKLAHEQVGSMPADDGAVPGDHAVDSTPGAGTSEAPSNGFKLV